MKYVHTILASLMSSCIVEGYLGAMNKAHDVVTVICDASLIWWPKRRCAEWNLKRVYYRYESQRYVLFGSHWLSQMVRPCVIIGWRHLKINKILFDSISEGARKLPSYLFLIFCRFNVNNGDTIIVLRHACERAWFMYSHGSDPGPEGRLVRIGYLKT